MIGPAAPSHTVEVFCSCDDIEHCRMELYVSDVRIAYAAVVELIDEAGEDKE
jgi:hypothetical protein